MMTLRPPAAYALAAVAGAAGWLAIAYLAQAVVAFLQNPSADLLPLGLFVFAVYAAVCSVPGFIGAAIRRRVEPTTGVAAR
jgi:hypothetical protein